MDFVVELVLGLFFRLLLAGVAWGWASSWPAARRGREYAAGLDKENARTKGAACGHAVWHREMV